MYKALIGNIRRAKDLGREETLKEVLEWLEEITIDDADGCGHPIVSFTSFDYKRCKCVDALSYRHTA